MRATILPGLVILAAGLVACGPNLKDFKDFEDSFDNPTGSVTEASLPNVFGAGAEALASNSVGSIAQQFDTSGSLLFALSASEELMSDQNYLVHGCDTNFRIRNGNVKKIIVDCTGNDDPSGKVTMQFEHKSDALAAIFLRYENWCAFDDCVDGFFGLRLTTRGIAGEGLTEESLAVADFDFTRASGETASLEWAFRAVRGPQGVFVEWMVEVETDGVTVTFVLSASVSATGGTLEVRGANGSFTCTYETNGSTGTCTDTEGNTITWTGA